MPDPIQNGIIALSATYSKTKTTAETVAFIYLICN